MCGIVGYTGDGEAVEKVFNGLKKLEYRGYDSAGIAAVSNPSLKIEKGAGTIDEVVEEEFDGETCIGHTRWATHGAVNDTNAHPHTDSSGRVAVVHNGIINNHEELKQRLGEDRFRSDTDTEVIPHLIEDELARTGSVVEACRSAMEVIEGSYAVVAAFESGEIVGFKKDSPLVIGIGDGEHFFASDVTPLLEHTDRAVFMEDGDLAAVKDGELEIYSGDGRVEREVKEIGWDPEQASKEGYDHFMEKEIREQSSTVKRAVFQDRSDLEKAVEMMERAENIYLTGCGTASYAASLGAKYLRDAGYDVETEQSHELEYRKDEIGADDLVIAVSQSGETADLLSVLKDVEAEVLAVVNVVGSTLARTAEHRLFVNAGPEIGVASTKAFTGQLAVLKLLKYAAAGEIRTGRKSLLETAGKIDDVLEKNEDTIEEISRYFSGKDDVYFIGRNRGYDVAREAALKLKELSYVHAEAFPGGEFKHGTLALVEDGVPVVSFLKSTGYDDILSNAIEARSRDADLIGVGTEEVDGFSYFIKLPGDDNPEILETVPFQMIAYLTSVEKGNNPDKPRNLAKSVTVK